MFFGKIILKLCSQEMRNNNFNFPDQSWIKFVKIKKILSTKIINMIIPNHHKEMSKVNIKMSNKLIRFVLNNLSQPLALTIFKI